MTRGTIGALRAANTGRFEMAEPTIAGRAPIAIDVEAGKTYYWCACGRSKSQPLCDGSHNALPASAP